MIAPAATCHPPARGSGYTVWASLGIRMTTGKNTITPLALLCVALATLACKGERAPGSAPSRAPGGESARIATEQTSAASHSTAAGAAQAVQAAPACADMEPLPWRMAAAGRVVAIGDLHGDLGATRRALRLAGAIDENDRWIGGELVVVQTGDILDRGDDEQAIMDLFAALRAQAAEAGGAVHVLNGNHELMNAAGDFRYVTPGGFRDFEDAVDPALGALAHVPAEQRARAVAFVPGGPYARVLAGQNLAIMIGDTIFAHGGVTPGYAERGLDTVHREVRCWLLGDGGDAVPEAVSDPDSPTWSRHFSLDPPACKLLQRSLDALGARRMIVGHTTHTEGITSACSDRVWRIDVGLAASYGGPMQVLEIRGDSIRVLAERH
jgi:hypothetical protein